MVELVAGVRWSGITDKLVTVCIIGLLEAIDMLRLVGRGGGGVAHHVRALATFGPPSVNGPSQKVKFKAPHKRYDERVSISHPVTNIVFARF